MGNAASIRFSERDSVADVLAARPGLAGSLAALHPAFGCFRNADAVQSLDGRVTLGDVARMAEVSTSDFLAFVNGENSAMPETGPTAETRPAWMDGFDEATVPGLDARPILAAGTDPFSEVIALADTVGENDVFVLHSPFDPIPLRRYLGARGFSGFAEKQGHRNWRVVFRRDGGGRQPPLDPTDKSNTASGSGEGMVNLDLRGLEPPGPMVTILKTIDKSSAVNEIVVTLEREPLFLFPELVERGWRWTRLDREGEGDEVRIRLIRSNRGDGA